MLKHFQIWAYCRDEDIFFNSTKEKVIHKTNKEEKNTQRRSSERTITPSWQWVVSSHLQLLDKHKSDHFLYLQNCLTSDICNGIQITITAKIWNQISE